MVNVYIREPHNNILKAKEEGGSSFVRDKNGSVIISEITIRKLLPEN